MKTKYLFNFVIAFSILSFSEGLGQSGAKSDQNSHINRDYFESLTDQLDYSKSKKRLVLKELDSSHESKSLFTAKGLGGGLFQLIAYVAIIALVGLILYVIFSGVKVDEQVNVEEYDLREVEDIKGIDAQAGYLEALNNQDYRLAVRMQFIMILQKLGDAQLILWRPEKTNKDYLRELRGTGPHAGFKELAHIYEWVWYGNTQLQVSDFRRFDEKFTNFNPNPS